MKSLGEFLRDKRKRLGFTQDAIAEKLNIVTPVLSKWENDKSAPDLTALCKLCNIFGISISDCINLENSENPILPPEEYNAVILGNTIKELRLRNDWTQSDVGQSLFVTSQTVSKWEAGGVTSLELLQKLSTLYAVSPEVLLLGPDSAPTPTSAPQEAPVTKVPNKRKTIISVITILLSLFIVFCAVLTALLIKNCNPNDDGEIDFDTFVLPLNPIVIPPVYNADTLCLDFGAPAGTEVYSVAAGTVELIVINDVLNYSTVTIDHGNGVTTIYNKIDIDPTLSIGDKVKAGQVIASVAPNAGASAAILGDYLCFTMLIDGTPVDPRLYIPLEND